MRSLYYRYCWHRVSNLFFLRYRHRSSSLRKAVYNPKAFILHAASLRQAFAHCGIFSTAATRRCLASVSVPMLGAMLSHPLPVIALVSHYLTNKLIGRGLLPKRPKPFLRRGHRVLFPLSRDYSRLRGRFPRVTNPFAMPHSQLLSPKRKKKENRIRLACLIHAASVHPEPGSNSQ